jgi:NADH-quinone oxidoreductase E subunit
MLSEQAKEEIRAAMARYPNSRSALMPALYIAQREAGGWLPPEAIADVAETMGLTTADVQGVASFYSMYYKAPVGRYVIDVCHNISCALLGSRDLLRHMLERLGVEEGEMTPDGLFTVKGVECLAACGGAPCLQVNGYFRENVTKEQADALLEDLRREAALAGTAEPAATAGAAGGAR